MQSARTYYDFITEEGKENLSFPLSPVMAGRERGDGVYGDGVNGRLKAEESGSLLLMNHMHNLI
jgi:hypothetical protein